MAFDRRQADTTAYQPSACAKVGFYACGAEESGGCCPVGYLCGVTACYPNGTLPDPTPSLASCLGHNGYFACPTGLGDGCCPGGYVCDAAAGCRLTLKLSIATTVITTTYFDVRSVPVPETFTITSVVGDGITAVGRVGLSTPTPTPPSEPQKSGNITSSNESALSPGQISGIVIGTVSFLVLCVSAGYLLRRRRRDRQPAVLKTNTSYDHHGKPELAADDVQFGELASETTLIELGAASKPQELPGNLEVYELESEPAAVVGRESSYLGERQNRE